MRLKKLQLQGFKSFAEKTTLEFDKGITGVVGPNGCGKSNVADAFRWVLGEQSAKSMRGLKMQDVIFAGTDKHKPTNFAEVTVTLTEVNGALQVPYEEIAVTRRLHRTGESTYLLNGLPVNLKDIRQLFVASGIGKNSLSIFEQGKIEEVLNHSPLERRSIFWEAAGIISFLQSKREARQKLESANNNVARLKDIHQEVENQMVILREQAEKAVIYKRQKAQLENLEKSHYVSRWDAAAAKHFAFQTQTDNLQILIDEKSMCIQQLEGRRIASKAALQSSEDIFRTRNEELFKCRSQIEVKNRERQLLEERLKEFQAKEARYHQENQELEQQQLKRGLEHNEAQMRLQDAEKGLVELEKVRGIQKEKVNAYECEMAKLREKQQNSQKEHLELHRKEAQLHSELKQNQVRLENNRERQAVQSSRLKKLKDLESDFVEQCRQKELQVAAIAGIIDQQKAVFIALEKNIELQLETIHYLKEEVESVQQERGEAKARHKALMRLKNDFEGFSNGTKRLLQASANHKSPLYGKLKGVYEVVVPHDGMQGAVAAALSFYEQTLIVESRSDLESVLSFAAKEKLGDFSLLCLDQENVDVEEFSLDLREGEFPLISSVDENDLSRRLLRGVYVVDKIERGWELASQYQDASFWCQEVGFLDSRGVLFKVSKDTNSIFLQEAEIKALESSLQQFDLKHKELESNLQHLQQKRGELHKEMLESDKTVRRSEMHLIESNFALQRSNGERDKNKHEQQQGIDELDHLNSVHQQLTALIGNLEVNHAAAKQQKEVFEIAIGALQEGNQVAITELQTEREKLQKHDVACQKSIQEIQHWRHVIELLEHKNIESRRQKERMSEELQQARELKLQLGDGNAALDSSLQNLKILLQSTADTCKEVEKEISLAKNDLAFLEKENHTQSSSMKKLESEKQSIVLLMAQQQTLQNALEQEIRERYQLTIEQARHRCGPLDISIDRAEKHLRVLRQELESSGDINMTSIEECAKFQTRYEFLQQQLEDLQAARDNLLKIIEELDSESLKLFREAFNAISANFSKNFSVLFNGGEASLQLVGSNDLIEAGVEILARPPGKQIGSISLLSGGEKCLTAMALLFAIFETKASPYCILDEIDAPLDDSNVDRFVNVLKQFNDRCQFIIITHNKRTMSIANRLFGVSMEQQGISKVLQMEFAQ